MPQGHDALTTLERRLLEKLLSMEFPGVRELREQARTVRAAGRHCGAGRSTDLVVSGSAPLAAVDRRIPVEGSVLVSDAEGVSGHLLLHVLDGRLSGLEYYIGDGRDADDYPQPELLEVSAC